MAFKVKNKKHKYVVFDRVRSKPVAQFSEKRNAIDFYSVHQRRGDKTIILVEKTA